MGRICIIPARGGSKRIPMKNIKSFHGKPIISYSIITALESNIFEKVLVSTDNKEIANVSQYYGSEVQYRSHKNSNDVATTFDVIKEVIDYFEQKKESYTSICCLYPCAPFVTADLLLQGVELMEKYKRKSVVPIVSYTHPIHRALTVDEGRISMVFPENSSMRTQDISASYHDAGQFYWAKTKELLNSESFFTDNTGYIELNALRTQDIDTLSDWKLAELKYDLWKNG